MGQEKIELIQLLASHGVVLKGGDQHAGARLLDELLVRFCTFCFSFYTS